jgi:hypothetical protein
MEHHAGVAVYGILTLSRDEAGVNDAAACLPEASIPRSHFAVKLIQAIYRSPASMLRAEQLARTQRY